MSEKCNIDLNKHLYAASDVLIPFTSTKNLRRELLLLELAIRQLGYPPERFTRKNLQMLLRTAMEFGLTFNPKAKEIHLFVSAKDDHLELWPLVLVDGFNKALSLINNGFIDAWLVPAGEKVNYDEDGRPLRPTSSDSASELAGAIATLSLKMNIFSSQISSAEVEAVQDMLGDNQIPSAELALSLAARRLLKVIPITGRPMMDLQVWANSGHQALRCG